MKNELTIFLVDDERNNREVISELIERNFIDLRIVGEAASVNEAFEKIEICKPQLVLLDIQMPRGNGFTLLKKYRELPFEVIFITSYDEYAINAIKFSALDYLLKPVELPDLESAIKKARKAIENKKFRSTEVINLLHNLDNEISNMRIPVHEGENVRLIKTNELLYITSNGRYSDLFTLNGGKHTIAKSLREFEDYFGEKSSFIRIHKECIINTIHVKRYSKGEHCFIELVDGKTFEVSRRKKQEVLERIKGHSNL